MKRCKLCKSPLLEGAPPRLSSGLVECLLSALGRSGYDVYNTSSWENVSRLAALGLAWDVPRLSEKVRQEKMAMQFNSLDAIKRMLWR